MFSTAAHRRPIIDSELAAHHTAAPHAVGVDGAKAREADDKGIGERRDPNTQREKHNPNTQERNIAILKLVSVSEI